MPRAVLLAAVATLALAATRSGAAEAKCASPRVVFAPADGARVPVAPVVYIMVPRYLADRGVTVLGDGQEISFWFDVVTRDPDADVVALRVQAGGGPWSRVTVRVDDVPGAEATYPIDRGWRAPGRDAVVLERVKRERSQWTCSHTDAFLLEVDSDAIAYRVEWAASAGAWESGTQSTQVLPRHRDDFWGAEAPRGATTLGLGHLSCLGETIPARALGGPLHVRVTGLLADGSTTAPWAAPVLLTEPAPEAEAEADPDSDPEADPDPDSEADHDPDHDPEHEHDPEHDRVLLLVLVLVLVVIAGALLVAWRRSRAARVVPPPR